MSANSLPLVEYLESTPRSAIHSGFVGYLAALTQIAEVAPQAAASIVNELRDQRTHLKLIASENYCSLATQLAMGNLLTDKYAEGYPDHRYYAGCSNVDAIEARACEEAKRLFGAEHAYVQPHSGADANLIAYWAILQTRIGAPALARLGETNPAKLSREAWETLRRELGNQKLLGLDYFSGGHLTHGYRLNVSAQMFDAHSYSVDRATGVLDYDAIERQAIELRPLILLAGYSSYPRLIDFRRMRAIADRVGAVLLVDMAHFAGLVAGKVFRGDFEPVAHAHVVTSTTHKTLRGPRGGLVLCKEEFREQVDKGCPLVIGGPLPHVMAAKLVALVEANKPEFQRYAERIVENSQALAAALIERGATVATRGTDNHQLLLDVRPYGLNGRQAESALREVGITLNRNSLPFDPNGPWYTSGLRIGTPAVTTLGMGPTEMAEIAAAIHGVLSACKPEVATSGAKAGQASLTKYQIESDALAAGRAKIERLLGRFPVYPELDLALLQKHFAG
jgi:glycine hydroxymethyltransferase